MTQLDVDLNPEDGFSSRRSSGFNRLLKATHYDSALALFVITIVSSFIAETIAAILVIRDIEGSGLISHILADAILSTALIFPLIYIFLLHPFKQEISQRKRAENSLQHAHAELETRVQERTTELAQANLFLQNEIRLSDQLKKELVATIETLENTQAELLTQYQQLEAAQEKIRQGHARYKELFEFAPDAYLVTDPDGQILEANQAAASLFQLEQSRLIGEPLLLQVDLKDKNRVDRLLLTLKTSLLHQEMDVSFINLSNVIIPTTTIVAPVLDPLNQVVSLRWLIHDITRRKQAEETANRLAAIVESSEDAIIGKTLDGIITTWNIGAQQMYGYSAQEAIGQPVQFLAPPELADEIPQILGRINHGEAIQHYETIRKRKDNQLIFISLSVSPIKDSYGRIIGASSIARDITDQKLAEEALRKAHTELGIQVQERTLDLAKAIHELQLEIIERKKVEGRLRVQTTALEAAAAEIKQRNQELVALYRAEQKAHQVTETLRTASLALTQTLDLDYVMTTLLEYANQLVPYSQALVMLYDEDYHSKAWIWNRKESSSHPEYLPNFDVETESHMPALTRTHQSYLVTDFHREVGWKSIARDESACGWIGVPLLVGGKSIGACELYTDQAEFFNQAHVQWIEALAGQTAIAIQNAWLFEQIRAGRERLQVLSRRLVEVQENERRYIARELHDEAGQMLTSLMIGLEMLEREARNPQAVVTGVAELNRLVESVLEELHRLAMDLRPTSLDHLGLVAAIRQHMENLSEKHKISFHFETVGISERLPSVMETELYRIVQESLTNIIRHANATRADVILERHADRVALIIEDNGVGFDPATPNRNQNMGLFGIRERAEILGGSLAIESSPGAGTTIIVEAPYAHPNTISR